VWRIYEDQCIALLHHVSEVFPGHGDDFVHAGFEQLCIFRIFLRAPQDDPRLSRIEPLHDFFDWNVAAWCLIPTLTHLDVSSVEVHITRIQGKLPGESEKPFRLKQRMIRQPVGESEAMPVELLCEQDRVSF
jgi:hypothetical protein